MGRCRSPSCVSHGVRLCRRICTCLSWGNGAALDDAPTQDYAATQQDAAEAEAAEVAADAAEAAQAEEQQAEEMVVVEEAEDEVERQLAQVDENATEAAPAPKRKSLLMAPKSSLQAPKRPALGPSQESNKRSRLAAPSRGLRKPSS